MSAPRLFNSPNALQTAVLKLTDDPSWTVRRQLAASLGALPATARVAPIVTMIQRFGNDPITVDAAISGLSGQEADVLNRLVQANGAASKASSRDDAIIMLAAAISRSRDVAATAKLFDIAGDPGRVMTERLAVLRGVETGLDGGTRRGGGGGGGRGRGGPPSAAALTFPEQPATLAKLAAGSGELAAAAARVAARVTWPGKPSPVVEVTPLTPAQQKQFSAGAEIYGNLCIACHQANGQGLDKIAPSLVNSRYVVADPGIGARIVISGKEGAVGLMPPLGASLSDEQIAAVLTYVRREWGHTASPVTSADVKEIRGMTAGRKRPWTEEEISSLAGGRSGAGGRGPGEAPAARARRDLRQAQVALSSSKGAVAERARAGVGPREH